MDDERKLLRNGYICVAYIFFFCCFEADFFYAQIVILLLFLAIFWCLSPALDDELTRLERIKASIKAIFYGTLIISPLIVIFLQRWY
jgi:uncharacterized paraquat-inducible protein A